MSLVVLPSRLQGHRFPALARLLLGLIAFGTGFDFLVAAQLGLSPWGTFAIGVEQQTPLSLGAVYAALSVALLTAAHFMKQRLGVGSVLNVLVVAVTIDLASVWMPYLTGWFAGASFTLGLLLMTWGTGCYVSAKLGAGPIDGLILGVAATSGLSVRASRSLIELTVFIIGLLLGAGWGIGTVAFALLAGPLMQFFLKWHGYRAAGPAVPGMVHAASPHE